MQDRAEVVGDKLPPPNWDHLRTLSEALAPADSTVPMINADIGIIRAFATARVPITAMANGPLKAIAMMTWD